MLYAKVVLGLPLEGPFDYSVPLPFKDKILVGSRVWVNFRNKKEVAYVVGLSRKTRIEKIKEISALIDACPVLDRPLLLLTKELSQYYGCSWGEAIEAALPDELRKGKEIQPPEYTAGARVLAPISSGAGEKPVFVQGFYRLEFYLAKIKDTLVRGRSVIILCTNLATVERICRAIRENLGLEPFVTFRRQPQESAVWDKIRQAGCSVVVGLRSAIFSCVHDPGLIIIDEPQDQVYKQEQSPHYHARDICLMRARIQDAGLILGSHSMSLKDFYLLRHNQLILENIPAAKAYPAVKIIDLRRLPFAERKTRPIFSKFLLDAIRQTLEQKGKVLIVVNRLGFATTVACHNCGKPLQCPRCNLNLVFHFEEGQLKCHHCNFKMPVPKICPFCQAGYIKYFGLGTEKAMSELARIFPTVRLGEDVVVSTGAGALHQPEASFDLVGVLGIDDLLNRVDFMAAEKVYAMLSGIANLTSGKIIVQSLNQKHHCLQALVNNDPELFLKTELKTRKQLKFSPFSHLIMLKLRGKDAAKAKAAAEGLFERLSKSKTVSLKLLWLHSGQPPKLRGNYYYQILMRAPKVQAAVRFLKLHLKESNFSGIIVTIDVDPV